MPELSTSPDTTCDFDLGALGRWTEAAPFTVTRDVVDAYAETVDAPPAEGAAPLFAVVPCYPILFASVDLVTPVALRTTMLHGEHDVTAHRQVEVGDVLIARGRPLAVAATRAGATVHVEIVVTDASGDPVATNRLTAVARGVTPARTAGSLPEPIRPAEADTFGIEEVPVEIAADQTYRYAEATGDRNAVHVDPARARAAGFDGVIAHGLGVLGLVTSALVGCLCPDDPSRLRRVRARFSAPVYPGQTMTMQVRRGERDAAFDVVTAAGTPALRGGYVELG